MKQYQLLLIAGLITSTACAAQDDKIESDRPGETQSVATIPKGFFQGEFGFRKEQQDADNATYFYPRAQLKYGVSKRVELRAELQQTIDKTTTGSDDRKGLKPVQIGFKAKLWEGKGVLPAASFYTQVGFPKLASKEEQVQYVFPMIRLLLENNLTKKLKLQYNAGAEWTGEEPKPQWLYTIQPQLEIGEKWEAFVELYGRMMQGSEPEHAVDGGFGYYPSHNIKLDISAGKGLTNVAPDYFAAIGISFRIGRK